MAQRGRPPINVIEVEKPIKFERVFEDENTIEIWKYDLEKSLGPINISVTYKNNCDKNWDNKQKQAKVENRIARQMKKINEKKVINKGKRGRPKKN